MIQNDEEFELLVLAYDYSLRRTSPFHVVPGDRGMITCGNYSYPDLIFERNSKKSGSSLEEEHIDNLER